MVKMLIVVAAAPLAAAPLAAVPLAVAVAPQAVGRVVKMKKVKLHLAPTLSTKHIYVFFLFYEHYKVC